MTSHDIIAEHAMGALPSDDVWRGLLDAAVDLQHLCHRWQNGLDIPRLDRVVHLDRGSFEFAAHRPDEKHAGAMIFVVRNHIGDAIDLAAWSPAIGRLGMWCSRGSMLGADTLFAPRMQDALIVHPDPLDWLRHLCRGVVVIDPRKAAPLLRRAQPLQASSIEHGRQLRKLLAVPPARIVVPAPAQRRAA